MAFIPSENVTSPDSIQNQNTILLKSSPTQSISSTPSLSSSLLEFDCELASGESIASNDGVFAATLLDGGAHRLQSHCLSFNQQ